MDGTFPETADDDADDVAEHDLLFPKQRTVKRMTPSAFYMTLRTRYEGKQPVRVLCVHGTGLRAFVALRLLRELEKGADGRKLCECFDLVVGSGIGGVCVIHLAKMRSAVMEFDRMLEDAAYDCFGKKKGALRGLKARLQKDSVEHTANFKAFLVEVFGAVEMMGKTERNGCHVAVTSVRTDTVRWRPYMFRSYHASRVSHCFAGSPLPSIVEAAQGLFVCLFFFFEFFFVI